MAKFRRQKHACAVRKSCCSDTQHIGARGNGGEIGSGETNKLFRKQQDLAYPEIAKRLVNKNPHRGKRQDQWKIKTASKYARFVVDKANLLGHRA